MLTNVYGLNDSNQMVGNFSYSTVRHGFYLTGVGGAFTPFDPPGSDSTNPGTFGWSINNSGAIAGQYSYGITSPFTVIT